MMARGMTGGVTMDELPGGRGAERATIAMSGEEEPAVGPGELLRMFIAPRATLRRVLDQRVGLWVWPLMLVFEFSQILTQAQNNGLGDRFSNGQLLLIALAASPIAAALALYLYGGLLRSVGIAMGGREVTPAAVRTAIAWATVPSIPILLGWLVMILALGDQTFTSTGLETGITPGNALPIMLVGLVFIASAVWMLVLGAKAAGEVFGYSAWRGLLAHVAAAVAMLAILMVAAFVIGLIAGLAGLTPGG